ncbi:MAG: hypothetical protein ACR2P4_02625 [Gammaproteobacteria bacterium]
MTILPQDLPKAAKIRPVAGMTAAAAWLKPYKGDTILLQGEARQKHNPQTFIPPVFSGLWI